MKAFRHWTEGTSVPLCLQVLHSRCHLPDRWTPETTLTPTACFCFFLTPTRHLFVSLGLLSTGEQTLLLPQLLFRTRFGGPFQLTKTFVPPLLPPVGDSSGLARPAHRELRFISAPATRDLADLPPPSSLN